MSQGFCTGYVGEPELEKLSELRAKTDRQVLSLLHSNLELGLNFAALAEDTNGRPDHAGQLLWLCGAIRHRSETIIAGADRRPIPKCRAEAERTSGEAGSPGPQIRHSFDVLTAF